MNTWTFASGHHYTEDSILEYINKRTSQNIVLKKSLLGGLARMLMLVSILGCILFALIKYRWILSIPIGWIIIAFLAFLLCCGGTVHNILHNAPLIGVTKSKTGETEYEYISTGVFFNV
jgi:hypothetical protein